MKKDKKRTQYFSETSNSGLTQYDELHHLDAIDCRILNILQTDNQLTNIALAKQVGLSSPPCLRRIQKLQESGIIQQNVAVLDPLKIGYQLVAFVHVTLEKQREDLLESFERKMANQEEVMQCYFISGDADYFLIIQVKNMTEYAEFARSVLSNEPNIKMFRSSFSLKRVKYKTKLKL